MITFINMFSMLPWHTIYLKQAAPLHVYFQWRRKNQGISVKLGMCLLFAALTVNVEFM